MAVSKLNSKKNKMIKLKLVMDKLQRSLQLGNRRLSTSDIDEVSSEHGYEDVFDNRVDNSSYVPKDVKEGHFAVVAMDEDGGVTRRFVVQLRYLAHPLFLGLLERAAEEYGFDHRGALTIPCRPSEIEMILAEW